MPPDGNTFIEASRNVVTKPSGNGYIDPAAGNLARHAAFVLSFSP
jgi:hypothetical protein